MIVGDANLAEVATFLKVGVTALVLAMIEDDFHPGRDLTLARPVAAIRAISRDPTLRTTVELASGDILDRRSSCSGSCSTSPASTPPSGAWRRSGTRRSVAACSTAGKRSCTASRATRRRSRSQLDWVAKLRLVEAYRDRHGLDWDDPRLAALDLQYHDLRPAKSLFARLAMERLTDDEEVARATSEPPATTRAYFRGRCLERFASAIVAANWDSVVFDVGEDSLRRVPMMEPLKGTARHVDTLFEGCDSPERATQAIGLIRNGDGRARAEEAIDDRP